MISFTFNHSTTLI